MRSRKHPDDDALREVLRRGDPAGDGRDPVPAEIAAWRRAMLEAAPQRVTWWRPVRVAAALAMVVVALVVGTAVWRSMDRPERLEVASVPESEEIPEGAEGRPSPPAPSGQATASGRDAPPDPLGEEASPPADAPSTASAPETRPVQVAAAGPSRTTPRARRTIHFTSARGTRIVWTINPELEL
jgi:hypothetical protein